MFILTVAPGDVDTVNKKMAANINVDFYLTVLEKIQWYCNW